jgi:hypothetical protein
MITQGVGAPRVMDGQTGKQLTNAFVTVKTAGVRELAERLERIGAKMGEPKALEKCVELAGEHIKKGYKAKVNKVTENLSKSVRIETKTYDAAAVAVIGPWQSGTSGATSKQASGNHAWLVEFGTDARKPGTNGRQTYLNVHQMINGKMKRHSSANNQQFANMSKGYYFLMSSYDEPTRQARMGSGYPHDFGFTNGKMHPITLHPGETIAPMPAQHAMEKTIGEQQVAVFNTLKAAIQNSLDRLTS